MLIKQRRGWGRLQPVPRFFVFIILSAITTVLTYQWLGLAISAAIVLTLFIAGRTYPVAGMISVLVAGSLTFLGNLFLHPGGTLLLQIGSLRVTTDSLEQASLLALRLVVMILLAIAYIAVTPNEELLLTARGLRVPKIAELYLMIVLRYIDILRQEFTTTMQAMTIRGIRWDGSLVERAHGLSKLPLPIIYRLMGHIHAQTLAIDSRGGVPLQFTSSSIDRSHEHTIEFLQATATYHRGDEITDDVLTIHPTTLTIEQGDRVAVLGRTGSGRSTLLLMAMGLIPHSVGRMAGQVCLFGNDTRNTSLSVLSQFARIVFPSAIHSLVGITVRDELNLSLGNRADSEKTMLEVLRQVGLNDSFLDRKTLELSGGEMQRVALASALITKPPILLLDDVIGQLDPVGKAEVLQAIQQIGKETTLLVTNPSLSSLAFHSIPFNRMLSVRSGNVNWLPTGSPETLPLSEHGVRTPQLVQLAQRLNIPQIAAGIPEAIAALKSIIPEAPREQLPVSPATAPIIAETRQLCFAYRSGKLALNHVNIAFYQQELTAILGSNGSGKTTLGLLLSKALKPSSGQIAIAPDVRVGYVFQEPTFQMLAATVADEIAFGPRQLGWTSEAIIAAVERELQRFDLPPDENPINLPPAQLRLLSIAAVLAMEVQMMILDEPTNGLDEFEIQSLMQLLRSLQQQGMTIVLVTHDVELACNYADRLLVMSQGNLLLEGAPNEVMHHPVRLREANVIPPPVVELSHALWSDCSPAVTIDQFAERCRTARCASLE